MEHKKDTVILVDEQDKVIGTAEKMEAHRQGLLHRAFSVLLFNQNNEILLQRRAWDKYHSPGLWTNTCCSHPYPDEPTIVAARRRLNEEMHIDCSIREWFSFVYKEHLPNGLTEHEFDHVFIGNYAANPEIDLTEVAEFKWMEWKKLLADMKTHQENYTVWFLILCREIERLRLL
jgi:isopentenyl-diphosphate delta-isomerase